MKEHARCPFCGAEALLKKEQIRERDDIWKRYKFIQCSHCEARTKGILYETYWDDGYDCQTHSERCYDDSIWRLWDVRVNK